MSEQEEIKLFDRIRDNIANAQRMMLIRKAKLGETVVIADVDGRPVEISAEEALRFTTRNSCGARSYGGCQDKQRPRHDKVPGASVLVGFNRG